MLLIIFATLSQIDADAQSQSLFTVFTNINIFSLVFELFHFSLAHTWTHEHILFCICSLCFTFSQSQVTHTLAHLHTLTPTHGHTRTFTQTHTHTWSHFPLSPFFFLDFVSTWKKICWALLRLIGSEFFFTFWPWPTESSVGQLFLQGFQNFPVSSEILKP